MDTSRANLLRELALDADLERGDSLRVAAEQMIRFLDANRDRIVALGGLTLIDEEPDFLSVLPDLTFQTQSRFLDADTGDWRTEIEVVDAPELVELYNPAEIYAAFADAARAAGSLGDGDAASSPAGDDDLVPDLEAAPAGASESGELYAEAADEWAAGQPVVPDADDEDTAARRLYDLALEYQERSQDSEARLLAAFEAAASKLASLIGDFVIVDDDDERLTLDAHGTFRAEVVPEDGDGEWRSLSTPTELVEFYDPTDVFGDLADALAEAYPGIAPEDGDDPDAAEDAAEDSAEDAAEDAADGAADAADDKG
ncbi:MAG: hypothetical protein AABZ33_00125 [Chloroflexota bacterium]